MNGKFLYCSELKNSKESLKKLRTMEQLCFHFIQAKLAAKLMNFLKQLIIISFTNSLTHNNQLLTKWLINAELFVWPITLFLQQLNQMFGKLIKLAYNYAPHIKHLKTTAQSIPNGVKVTYPNVNNKTHDIQNPLQTFISSIAACETAALRHICKQKGFKLGSVRWGLIESDYDLSHWMTGGGKDNKINDIYLEAEIESDLDQAAFDKIKAQTQNLCPIYQIITAGGVKINSQWKLKKIA